MNKRLMDIANGIAILAKYPGSDFQAEHDEIWCGPTDSSDISDEDRTKLEAMGWSSGEDYGWHTYV